MGPPGAPQTQSQQSTHPTRRPFTDHPATPLASVGPPNFSYGSATHVLPGKISVADTKISIFAAMNKAAQDAKERELRAGKISAEEETEDSVEISREESFEGVSKEENSQTRTEPRRSTRSTRKSVEPTGSTERRRTASAAPSEGGLCHVSVC
jgi:hypothetical protein